MTATISMTLRDGLLREYFLNRPGSFVYAAVSATAGLSNSPGDLLTEPDGAGYGRVELECTADIWALSGFGDVFNIDGIDFPDASDDWGYLGGWALLDAPASGMTLAVGSLVQPGYQTVDMPAVSLTPGAITVRLM